LTKGGTFFSSEVESLTALEGAENSWRPGRVFG